MNNQVMKAPARATGQAIQYLRVHTASSVCRKSKDQGPSLCTASSTAAHQQQQQLLLLIQAGCSKHKGNSQATHLPWLLA